MTLQGTGFENDRDTSDVLRDGLLQQVLRLASQDSATGLTIALTSVDPDAQTLALAEMLAEDLGVDNGGSSLCLDSRALTAHAGVYPGEAVPPVSTILGLHRKMQWPQKHEPQGPEKRDRQSRLRSSIGTLRDQYQYTLIACPAIKTSPDILALSSLVDGILVVVEANHTRQREIELVEKTILSVHGSIIGHILDKQVCFIPRWLCSLLPRLGI